MSTVVQHDSAHASESLEPCSEKIAREVNLALAGTASGIAAHVSEAAHNPLLTFTKVAAGAAVSVTYMALSSAMGPGSLIAKSAEAALIGTALYHSGSAIKGISSAAADAWHSGANFEADKKLVGDAVGPMFVYTAIASAGSLVGAGLRFRSDAAQTKLYPDIPCHNMSTLRQMDPEFASIIKGANESTVMALRQGEDGLFYPHGSGFMVDKSGLIATAEHVVAGQENNLTIGIPGDGIYPAKVVGTSPEYDCALLKIEPNSVGQEFVTAKLSDNPGTVKVRDSLVAVGYPAGMIQKASVGKVRYPFENGTIITSPTSGKHRIRHSKDGTFEGFDTNIGLEGGMSGGPLYDRNNEVVGVSVMGHKDLVSNYASIKHIHDLVRKYVSSEAAS